MRRSPRKAEGARASGLRKKTSEPSPKKRRKAVDEDEWKEPPTSDSEVDEADSSMASHKTSGGRGRGRGRARSPSPPPPMPSEVIRRDKEAKARAKKPPYTKEATPKVI